MFAKLNYPSFWILWSFLSPDDQYALVRAYPCITVFPHFTEVLPSAFPLMKGIPLMYMSPLMFKISLWNVTLVDAAHLMTEQINPELPHLLSIQHCKNVSQMYEQQLRKHFPSETLVQFGVDYGIGQIGLYKWFHTIDADVIRQFKVLFSYDYNELMRTN